MLVKNKIEKPFGPAATSTGITMFIAGIVCTYFSLVGIILIVIGAFLGFTSEVTFLEKEKKRIRFSNMLFGIFPTGKWIDVTSDMKISIVNNQRGFRTYSRGMRTNDMVIKDRRIVLFTSKNKKLGPIMKCESLEAANKSVAELSLLFELKN